MPVLHTASPAAYAIVKRFEGLSYKAYCCPAGIPTIGYGHTGPGVTLLMPMASVRQVEAWLVEDIKKAEGPLNQALELKLTSGQFDALVSIVFNVGPGHRGYRDGIITLASGQPSTLLRLVNAGDFKGAAAQFLRWDKAVDPVTKTLRSLPGLVTRRKAERDLFLQ